MKHAYLLSLRTKICIGLLVLILGGFQTAKACHGVNIVGLNSVVTPTDITISGSSDGQTCGCGPYYMEVELTCNPAGFTGAPPFWNSPLWNQVGGTWWHSLLNVPNYTQANGWPDNCVLEPYNNLVIPFASLCPGTQYYWRVRENPAVGTPGPWSGTFTFTTPGLPPTSILSTTSSEYDVCTGDTVQLNASVSGGCPGATFTYSWLPVIGLSNPNIPNPTAIINNNITYTVTVTGGCFTLTTSDDTVRVELGPPPIAGVVSANPIQLCSGQSSLLTLAGNNSTVIQWQVSTNGINWFNVPGGNNNTLNTGPMSNSLYFHAIVYGTGWPNGSGCGQSISNDIFVQVQPAPVISIAAANTTICTGGCDTLTASGGVSYTWSSNANNAVTAQVSVCPISNTTYSVTATDALGCTGTAQFTVNVSSATVTASPDVSICNSSSTVLLATAPNGTTYSWAPAGSLSNANVANPTASPTVTTTYTVTATNAFGCTATDVVTVTVTLAPPITASADTSMCAGGIATLTVSGASTYTWTPGNLSGSSVSVNPLTTTTYVVTGNTNNCISYDTVVVNVDPIPQVFAGPDFPICQGTQGTLTATGGGSYAWLPTSTIIGNANQASVVINPTVTTTYTVTVTSPSGCISQDQITVTVNGLPTVTATATQNPICLGGTTTLSGAGAIGYTWIPNVGLGNPNQASTSAQPTNTTTYQVVGVDANGCTGTASITVTVITPPIAFYTSSPNECGDTTGIINVSGVVGAGGPYTYLLNGGPSVPDANGNFPPVVDGNFTMTVIDQYGCSFNQNVTVPVAVTATVTATGNPLFGVAPLTSNFSATGSSGVNNYFWTFGDSLNSGATGQNTSFIYTEPGIYPVTVQAYNDFFGCSVYYTFYVEVVEQPQFVVPNVFTPNGDNKNDGYMINITGVKELSIEVLDRWGRKVGASSFNNEMPAQHDLLVWDGTTNGNTVSDGVYYYVINATGYDLKPYTFKGFIQVSSGK